MSQIITPAGSNPTLEDHRHLLGRAIGEVEIKLSWFDREQLAGAIQLRLHLFLHISQWYYSCASIIISIS